MVDWDSKVLAPVMNVFGESVTYELSSGKTIHIQGVFDEAYKELVSLDSEMIEMNTVMPVLGVRAILFPHFPCRW